MTEHRCESKPKPATRTPEPTPCSPAEFLVALDLIAQERLRRFAAALLDENTRINLTATRDADAFWATHVCDSLALAPLIHPVSGSRLLDLGSGGGLPGLPLACVFPQLAVVMLDSTRKKVEAVKRIALTVALTNAEAFWGRAESLFEKPELRAGFDCVTARAVAELSVLIPLAAPYLRLGGSAWFFKSTQAAETEIAVAGQAARAVGLELDSQWRYELPSGLGERLLIRYQKINNSPPPAR